MEAIIVTLEAISAQAMHMGLIATTMEKNLMTNYSGKKMYRAPVRTVATITAIVTEKSTIMT